MIFFTADTHFNHKNIIKYCNRPFETVEEMNKTMINNWNNKVGALDTIYHLGDFGFGDIEPIRKQLNGNIILISGSHDKSALDKPFLFSKISPLLEINEHNHRIILCHYAMRTWSKSHYNSWHLYGHSHGHLESWGKSFDAGVDGWGFTPLSINDVITVMNGMLDNFNLVKK